MRLTTSQTKLLKKRKKTNMSNWKKKNFQLWLTQIQ